MSFLRPIPLIALVALLAGSVSANAQQPPAGWHEGYVLANGIRIHYWRTDTAGGRPSLVLAHEAKR